MSLSVRKSYFSVHFLYHKCFFFYSVPNGWTASKLNSLSLWKGSSGPYPTTQQKYWAEHQTLPCGTLNVAFVMLLLLVSHFAKLHGWEAIQSPLVLPKSISWRIISEPRYRLSQVRPPTYSRLLTTRVGLNARLCSMPHELDYHQWLQTFSWQNECPNQWIHENEKSNFC